MGWAWLVLYLGIMLLTGYAAVLSLYPRQRLPLPMTCALACLLGPAAVGFLLFMTCIGGIIPGRVPVGLIGAAALGAVAVQRAVRTSRSPAFQPVLLSSRRSANAWLLVPVALAVIGLLIVLGEVGFAPIQELDAWAIWIFKAKWIASGSLSPTPAVFTDPGFVYAHQAYPLLLPTLAAGACGVFGSFSEHAARAVLPVLYLGLGLIVYGALRPKLDRLPAACCAALQLLLPSVLHYAGVGYADVMLAAFYPGNIVFAVRWLETGERRDLVVAGLFGAAGAFTKNEGLPLALINLGVVFAMRFRHRRARSLADAAAYLLAFVLPLGPWLIWSRRLPVGGDDFITRMSLRLVANNARRLPEIIRGMTVEFLRYRHWGPLWVILPAFAWIGSRAFREPAVRAVWAMLLLHAGLYAAIYLVSPNEPAYLIPSSIERLVVHVTPAAILAIGLHWASINGAATPSPFPTASARRG